MWATLHASSSSLPMPPGVNGLVALPAVALFGHAFAALASSRLRHVSEPAARLVRHSIATVVVATTFWFWAAYKVLSLHDPDLGVVSFLICLALNYRVCGRPADNECARFTVSSWHSVTLSCLPSHLPF